MPNAKMDFLPDGTGIDGEQHHPLVALAVEEPFFDERGDLTPLGEQVAQKNRWTPAVGGAGMTGRLKE